MIGFRRIGAPPAPRPSPPQAPALPAAREPELPPTSLINSTASLARTTVALAPRAEASTATNVAAGLTCPLTGTLMRDPVVLLADGWSYEAAALRAHLGSSDRSPVTLRRLADTVAVPNVALRNLGERLARGEDITVDTPELRCPVSLDVMRRPMIDERGHSYEESSELQWLAAAAASGVDDSLPLTGERAEHGAQRLARNVALERIIDHVTSRHERLHQAVLVDDVATLASLLAHHDPDRATVHGATALIFAAKYDRLACMAELLRCGATVDACDGVGMLALHHAVERANDRAVECLLAAGANVEATMPGGFRPLMLAASNQDVALVEALLRAGAKVNASDAAGWPALLHATTRSTPGSTQVVHQLLMAGADPRQRGAMGFHALDVAQEMNDPELIALLRG